jgi:hypothetical protein
MAGMDISYGDDGNGLTVWFDQPHKASQTEETDSGIILRKDDEGHVIGVHREDYFETSPKRDRGR